MIHDWPHEEVFEQLLGEQRHQNQQEHKFERNNGFDFGAAIALQHFLFGAIIKVAPYSIKGAQERSR